MIEKGLNSIKKNIGYAFYTKNMNLRNEILFSPKFAAEGKEPLSIWKWLFEIDTRNTESSKLFEFIGTQSTNSYNTESFLK